MFLLKRKKVRYTSILYGDLKITKYEGGGIDGGTRPK